MYTEKKGSDEQGYPLTSRQKEIWRQFEKLVAIDSPTYQEGRMSAYLQDRLTELGLAVEIDDAAKKIGGETGNIYAYLEGDRALSPLMFSAHMDTVEPARGKKAVLGEDGMITSDGTTVLGADDCAGIAAVLGALERIQEEARSHRPIEVLFSAAEETYCEGIRAFDCSKLRSREAYVLDLTGPVGHAANQAPTILTFRVQIIGRSAHAGFAPEDGIHAVKIAAEAVSKLKMGRIDEETTFNIGLIEGGAAGNIVPERCVIQGEIRSYSHEKASEQAEIVEGVFRECAAIAGADIKFHANCHCRAYRTDEHHPVVRRFQKISEAKGLPFHIGPTFGGSDNNQLSNWGIQGIVLATAMNRCHSCEEYTSVQELEHISDVVLELMCSDE